MFHNYGARKPKTKPLKDLLSIVSAEQLLAQPKRKELLNNMQQLIALDDACYTNCYLSLLHNVAHHCQTLPETANSYYSQAGGLIDHALYRTVAALEMLKDYLIVEEGAGLSEEQKLWQYALFSAGLLLGIGKLYIDFSIEVFDSHGQSVKEWNPLLEHMNLIGNYYNYSFEPETETDFRCRLNILLAKFLMPAAGYAWIASEPEVLATWLALLNEDPEGAGTLGALLIRADALAIQHYINETYISATARVNRANRAGTFGTGGAEAASSLEIQTGIEFTNWLTQALATGAITINQAYLSIIPGGLLMSTELFQQFIRETPNHKNWQAVQKGFLALQLHKTNADGSVLSRFEQTKNQKMLEGITLKHYAVVLPEKLSLQNPQNGKTSTVSALELIHSKHTAAAASQLAHLNQKGQWELAKEINLAIQANIGMGSHG